MRLVEILSYRLKANTAPAFHKLVREQSVPLLTAWGTDVVAYGISAHEADAYDLIRAYKDARPTKAEAPPVKMDHNAIPRAATEAMVTIPGYGKVSEKVARRIGLI